MEKINKKLYPTTKNYFKIFIFNLNTLIRYFKSRLIFNRQYQKTGKIDNIINY